MWVCPLEPSGCGGHCVWPEAWVTDSSQKWPATLSSRAAGAHSGRNISRAPKGWFISCYIQLFTEFQELRTQPSSWPYFFSQPPSQKKSLLFCVVWLASKPAGSSCLLTPSLLDTWGFESSLELTDLGNRGVSCVSPSAPVPALTQELGI